MHTADASKRMIGVGIDVSGHVRVVFGRRYNLRPPVRREKLVLVGNVQNKTLRAAGTTRATHFRDRHNFCRRRICLRQNDVFTSLRFLH